MTKLGGRAEAAMRSSGFLYRLHAGVLLVSLMVIALAGWSMWQNFDSHHEQARLATFNLARTLENDLAGEISANDMVLMAVIDRYSEQLRRGAVDAAGLNAYIEQVRKRRPGIDAIRITDERGILRYGSGVRPEEHTSLADRPHFIGVRDDPAAGLVFSPPQVSRVNNKWVLVMARRIANPDGSFAGMAIAAIPLRQLSQAFATLDIGRSGMVALRDADLGLVERYPESARGTQDIGSKPPAAEQHDLLATGDLGGSYTAVSALDGIERTISYRRVADYPFYVQVGWAEDDYLAASRSEAANLALLVGFFVMLMLAASWMVSLSWQRQRKINHALAESETRLTELFENMSSGVAVYRVSEDGQRFVFSAFNRAAERIENLSRGDLLGREVTEAFPGIAELGLLDVFRRVWRSGIAERFPLSFYRDGRISGWRDNFVYKLPGGDIVAIFDDVTERKQAEEELRRSEKRYRAIFDHAAVGIAQVAPDGRFLEINQVFCDIIGYAREEVLGLGFSFQQVTLPVDLETDLRQVRRLLDGEDDQYRLEKRYLRKDGQVVWVNLSVALLRNSTGQPLHFISSVVDITERKRVEEELRRSEATMATLMENVSALIYLKDRQGRYLFANRKALDLWGLTREEVLGVGDDRLYDAATAAQIREVDREVLEEGRTVQREESSTVASSGKTQTFLSVKLPLRRTDGSIYALCGISTDISSRIDFERKLKETSDDLQRSNADLERFAYSVSHDMRQPLRAVSGHLQLLARSLKEKLDEEERENLKFALEGAKRMDSMILSLLEYSRVGRKTGARERMPSRESLEEALEFLEPMRQQSDGRIEVRGEWPEVTASRDELTRLFQNLIGNGLHYHEAGVAPQVEVESEVAGGQWRVRVRDHGIGIAPAQIDRLFQFFSRLQARTKFDGTGMGLALCRRIVEHHSGRIWAESEGEGRGSAFCFEMPITLVAVEEAHHA